MPIRVCHSSYQTQSPSQSSARRSQPTTGSNEARIHVQDPMRLFLQPDPMRLFLQPDPMRLSPRGSNEAFSKRIQCDYFSGGSNETFSHVDPMWLFPGGSNETLSKVDPMWWWICRSSPWGPIREVRLSRPSVNLSRAGPYGFVLASTQNHACPNAQPLGDLSQTLQTSQNLQMTLIVNNSYVSRRIITKLCTDVLVASF